MTEEQENRIEELTTILLSDLKRYSSALDSDMRFEIVKAIRERINRLETELQELLLSQNAERDNNNRLRN